MVSERQCQFRETYKSNISPLYNGILHVAVTFGAGIAAIAYCVSQMRTASWEWLSAIPVFLGGNFAEWFMHRYVMHRRINVFALRAIYERHTRQHQPTSGITSQTDRPATASRAKWRAMPSDGTLNVPTGWSVR